MLFNKNNVRKVNDRKVLHKVGKNWKVVSLALLMAIGGGAVATHANANASSNNNANNNEYLDIQGSKYINSGYVAPSSAASSKSAQPAKPASNISYLPGYGGSAASYHAKAQSDEANYKSNQKIVNSYVNSINAKFPNRTNSLNSNYNSASAQVAGDKASAQSYSAIAAQSNYSSQVSTLASKAGLTYSGYVQSVSYTASSYASAVSNGASVVSQVSEINSYAQLISNINGNTGLQDEYRAKADSADDAYAVDSAYTSNESDVYNNLLNDSASNEDALNSAGSGSAANSAAEEIAHINSGRDAATTNSLAKSLGYTNTSSEVSSENSSNALSFADNSEAAYHNVKGSVTNVLVSSNSNNGKDMAAVDADNMSVLLKDTAVMQNYGSLSAAYNSEIASASAAKASLANAVASASAALQSDDNVLSSASDVKRVDDILATGNLQLSSLFGSVVTKGGTTANTTTNFNNIADNIAAANGSTKGIKSAVSIALNNNDAQAVADALAARNNVKTLNSENTVVNETNGLKNILDNNDLKNAANTDDVTNVLGDLSDANQAVSIIAGLSVYDPSGVKAAFSGGQDNNLVSDVHNLANAFNALTGYTHTASKTTPGSTYFDGKGLLDPRSYGAALNGTSIQNYLDDNVSSDASAINSVANSAANSYGNEQSASSSYSAATNENVTLAGIYATSYSDDATSDENVASAAKNSLDTFYLNHADVNYANASSAASSAAISVPNDNALAYANGMHVYNYGPKYITVIKKAAIHTNANYGKFGDQKIANVPVGTKLTVLGNGFTLNGGVVYHVNFKGNDGFITNLPDFVKQTYLNPGEVSVNVNQDSSVHSNANTWDKSTNVGVIKAGQTIKGTVFSVDGIRGGFTRLAFQYRGNTYYTSSNTDYVSLNDDAVNNNGNADENNNGNNNNVPSNSHVIFGA